VRASVRVARARRVQQRKLRRHCLAKDYGASPTQPRDTRCILLGAPPGERRAVLGPEIGSVEDVLDADRHPVQRAGSAAQFQRPVARPRLRQSIVGIEVRPGLHVQLALGDAIEAGAHKRLRGEPALADRFGCVGGAERGGSAKLRRLMFAQV